MGNGPELFYESWEESLKDDIKAIGGTKAVGKMLWADLDQDLARNRLNDRLNPERRERLAESQERLIMRLAREKRGWSAAICYLADETGFERPKSKVPEDELTELIRQFTASVPMQKHNVDRIEGLLLQLSKTTLKAI